MVWPRVALRRLLIAVCLSLGVAGRAAPSDATQKAPEADPQRLEEEIADVLELLDSSDYAARRRAVQRCEALLAVPEHKAVLAAAFREALRCPEVSFEVRSHLARWLRRLPESPLEPAEAASPEELDLAVRQLNAAAYGVRLAAVRRLEWYLGNGKLVGPITRRVEARFSATDVPAADLAYLDEVWRQLRPIWSQSNPEEWNLPEVSDETVRRWVEDVAEAAPFEADGRRTTPGRAAARALRDLLMRDEYVRRIAHALRTRLERPAPADARARLQALLDETRPAMVAEYWQGGQHLVEQHLLVDVPSQSDGAVRPSHFDRIDDSTARCVSGSSLSPGEYPVGVAIPHPRTTDALFHLVNLPTPRRRAGYMRDVQTDPAARLREISRRTVDWLRAQERPVDEDDLRMLAGLDPGEVSRFAGWYFTAIADSPLPPWAPRPDPYEPGRFIPLTPPAYHGGRPSRHGAICLLLAADGTRAAVPGLLEAIRKDQFMPPSAAAPYRLAWIAALSIAWRDPWPEVDLWLAGAVTNEALLKEAGEPAAEVGATAAAILLARHGQPLSYYGLHPAGDAALAAMGLSGYRFTKPADRGRVLQWYTTTISLASQFKVVASRRTWWSRAWFGEATSRSSRWETGSAAAWARRSAR